MSTPQTETTSQKEMKSHAAQVRAAVRNSGFSENGSRGNTLPWGDRNTDRLSKAAGSGPTPNP